MTITEAEARRREREAVLAFMEWEDDIAPRRRSTKEKCEWLDERYPPYATHQWESGAVNYPLPTPAPAKEPEWYRLWTEINSLARKADDFDWKINGLLARVRALEGK